MSFLKSIKRVKPVQKEEREIHKLVSSGVSVPVTSFTNLRSTLLAVEKRKGSTVQASQLETLFRIDSLTFRIVQKYIEKILGGSYVIKGENKIIQNLCIDFCKDIDLLNLLSGIIFDIFVTGNGTAWIELGYTEDGSDIKKITLINPKSGIDLIRDEQGNILYDKDLKPVGYCIKAIGYPKIEWRKDKIIQDGEVVWKANSPKDDGRDRIAYFRFINTGDELGMSPLEPSYKAALIRLNLEDTVGNVAFRSSGLIGVVGSENEDPRNITDQQLDTLKNELVNADQFSVWAVRNNVDIKSFPTPNITNFERLMYYFADLQSSGSGVGISLILQPLERGYRGDIEIAREEFFDTVKLFQESLSYQIREYIFKRLLKCKGYDPNKAPIIIFKGREAGIALSTARRLSAYARYNLIKPTPELEKWIRIQEGLPEE